MHKSFVRITKDVRSSNNLRDIVVALGNFDGVHKGHNVVLQTALLKAKEYKVPAVVFSFEPHPKAYFSRNKIHRLTSAEEKAKLVQILGFNAIIEQDFNEDFAKISADKFIEDFLITKLAVKSIVVGEDFCFGYQRKGNIALLQRYAEQGNFTLEVVPAQKTKDGIIISSTNIRESLCKGDVAKAASMLGYRYNVVGVVQPGAKLGRTIGYPTANITFEDSDFLSYGIYAIKLKRANGQILDGVASFGVRPTVTPNGQPILESFLFDFYDNLYNEKVSIALFDFIRYEVKFQDLPSLIKAIKNDIIDAKNILAKSEPLSLIDKELNFSNNKSNKR